MSTGWERDDGLVEMCEDRWILSFRKKADDGIRGRGVIDEPERQVKTVGDARLLIE